MRRRYTGEYWFATYNQHHAWYYLADQEHDEVTMLKIFDSDDDVDAKCTAYPDLFTVAD